MTDYRYLVLAGTIYVAAALGKTSPQFCNAVGLSILLVALALRLGGKL